jgi:D-amino-acid dehydrogenase
MRTAVVGAGIAGITAAYYLARTGYQITVFDQEPHAAMRTSFANGGQISVSNSEVWNTWHNVVKGLQWMLQKDAPLLIRPRLDWNQLSWLAQFLWHTARGSYEKNTAKTIQLGIKSRKLLKEIEQLEKIEFDQSYCGILHYYKSKEYFDRAIIAKRIYEEHGCEWKIVTNDFYDLDPALKNITGVLGGAWTEDDWVGDIHKFCYQLAQVLEKKYEVHFQYNTKINHVNELKDFDRIVVSNGVGSRALAKTVGDSLCIYPVKGYSITINNVDPELLPRVGLLDDQVKIVTSTLGNRFRVAGTAELVGENYDIRRDRIQPLLNWVRTNFPKINTHDYSQWACLRPMTPDMIPIVRQSRRDPRVYYHTGHGHLGWTMSAATAEQLIAVMQNTN